MFYYNDYIIVIVTLLKFGKRVKGHDRSLIKN